MLVALSMGMAFSHLLEMPAKMNYSAALWLKLLQTLYWGYGTIGAVIEVGAVVASVVLVFMVRHHKKSVCMDTIISGVLCMVAAHAAWWIWVRPVNAILMPLTPKTLPANWMALRNQWEYTHAARAILQIIALGSLVLSILVDDLDKRIPGTT